MEEKFPKIKLPQKNTLLSALAVCLLLLSAAQCGRSFLQNRALTQENETLSAALAGREQVIADKERILANSEQLLDDQAEEIEDLQKQHEKAMSIEENETPTGFIKKGDVYLIDEVYQLLTLERLIAGGSEIEPGVSAAEASYRLRNDLTINNNSAYGSICLGTEEFPFCGSFDGDGHTLDGAFSLMDGSDVPKAVFFADAAAKIENLRVINRMSHYFTLGERPDCEKLEEHLPDCSACWVQTGISAWDLDVREAAQALRTYWERNCKTDGACVSMTFYPDQDREAIADAATYLQNLHTALCTLAGTAYTEIIEAALPQGTDYLWFVRLEQIGELTCCTFEISEPAYGPNNYGRTDDSYYIIVEGNWEGKEVPIQCFHIPYTKMEMSSIGRNGYHLEEVDLNFDGKSDLLIHEGSSGGSGGSWGNYRALVWKEDAEQFADFPSFPEQVSCLEFDRQRLVDSWRSGTSYECVDIYNIVNGEYECTRSLILQTVCRSEEYVTELSYYEMGELVESRVLSDEDKVEDLYPDMNYWSKG